MKKFRTIKSKIIMFIFALVFPLSATGLVYSTVDFDIAKADDTSTTTNYYSGYMKEVDLTNNNFNSSSSTYSISTSLSGWTGQETDKKTTAGIINTGNTFQNYMTGTYRLSNNPLAKATDKHILMINSKTSDSSNYQTARQGYKSSKINLDANSFYSFQVSFKSDTNYNSYTTYVPHGDGIDADMTILKKTFEAKGFGEYIEFTYKSKTYYLNKTLEEAGTLSTAMTNVDVFYEDEEYLGFIGENGSPVYTAMENVVKNTVSDTETTIDIAENAQLFTCDLEYDATNTNYKVAKDTTYYTTKTEYSSLNDYVYGSIYLDGLTDENGDPIKAEYVQVSSKEWITFYFFVATGNNSQTVTMDLWLGTKVTGHESSGVVFFDDCHVYQYSENSFWKTYQSYFGRNYTQEFTDSHGNTQTTIYDCVNFTDLRNKNIISLPAHNLDFEEGVYNEDSSSLKNWTKSGTGNAQVFNAKAPQYFKTTTGYDFVGSNLSSDAKIDDEKVEITPNNYVLGLWANDETVKVTSNDISINANEIYKIKAYYKISELSDGNAYMFVQENDNVLSAYNLTEEHYNLTAETASNAISSNGSSAFSNEYGTIEFYVKGGALYNSSINVSLGLGTTEENATGCVLFDDITVEKATTAEYESASNKVELNSTDATLTVSNGNFNKFSIDNSFAAPYEAQNWTVKSGDGITFNGVISTEEAKYQEYVNAYRNYTGEDTNPYYWASWSNPKNSKNSTTDPDNIMMLSNIHSTWQKLSSENLSLSANSTYKLTFKYKTVQTGATNATFKVSIKSENNVELFKSQDLTSNGTWTEYSIYLKSFAGATNARIEIDFGTDTTGGEVQGFAYFDNFEFNSISSDIFTNKASTAEGNGDVFGVVDMTNFYLNLPTNNISNEVNQDASPAYTCSPSIETPDITGAIVNSDRFKNSQRYAIEGENKNVFFLQSQGPGSYTIQSNYNIDLEADKYYSLSFKVKTGFYYAVNGEPLDSTEDYNYGLTIGLTGYDLAKNIESNDGYETYTLYFKATESTSTKLYIALVCKTTKTSGSAVIYDFTFEESDESTYTTATTTTKEKTYDLNTAKVFVAEVEGSADNEDVNDSNDADTTPTDKNSFDWLLIPTLITALAIVIAVVGSILRKIKIKKIERKKKESYDRKSSLNIDVAKQKAKQQRDAEIVEVTETINKFQKELDSLEKAHKEKVVSLRAKDKGKVSKETDKEFKQFAQKRTVIAEKIDSLNKQIETIKSPEYLLNLERKIYSQEELKRKELSKISKKLNKEQDKKSK